MTFLSGTRQNQQTIVADECRRPSARETMFLVKSYGNRILDALPEAEAARLQLYMESGTLAAGASLYEPDDKIQYLYFPETAVVSQYCILEDGRTLEIAMIGREGLTGHAAVFGAPRAAFWTQVSVAGKASKISLEAIKQEFDDSDSLKKLLLNYSNQYTTQISNRVICNNYHSIEERFGSWLLMLSDRHGTDKLSLTHSQIANYLGVHRPSFTHIAKKLREKKVIDYSRGHLTITDRGGLGDFACECYRENTAIN